MARGFRFAETMSGTFVLAVDPGTTRRFSFCVEARAPSVWRHLVSGGATELSGLLEADDFADSVPVSGTMTLAPLTRRIIGYELSFVANDGQSYAFRGQKNIRLSDLRASFTTLPGSIVDERGQQVAEVLTRFDLSADWFQFLASWRPA